MGYFISDMKCAPSPWKSENGDPNFLVLNSHSSHYEWLYQIIVTDESLISTPVSGKE